MKDVLLTFVQGDAFLDNLDCEVFLHSIKKYKTFDKVCFIKNISLEKQEWLKKYNIRAKELNFRQGKNYFVPYIKFSQNDQNNNSLEKQNNLILPITKIIISPKLKSDFDRVEAGLRMLLNHNGYQHVRIVSSEIPYRV